MPVPQSPPHAQIDFVDSDFEALASHMRHCARAHGRWSSVRGHMQRASSLAAGRIVTVACMACLAAALGAGLLGIA